MGTQLIGSEKQQSWARRIISELQEQTNKTLPDIRDARFWIDHRKSPIEDVFLDAMAVSLDLNKVCTAFTTHYSRYGRVDAMQALDSLDHAVALDCETNGTGKDSEVIELAIVEIQTGDVLFNSLIQPTDLTVKSEQAQSAHQITRGELEKAPMLSDVWPLLCSILVSHPLVAYNDKFDIPMIRRSVVKYGIQPPRLYSTCAMKLFSAYQETDDWYSLDEACTIMNIDRTPFGDAHRALADTQATCALVNEMRQS